MFGMTKSRGDFPSEDEERSRVSERKKREHKVPLSLPCGHLNGSRAPQAVFLIIHSLVTLDFQDGSLTLRNEAHNSRCGSLHMEGMEEAASIASGTREEGR